MSDTGTDWAATATEIEGFSCTNWECDHHECRFLRAAAVGLRRLAAERAARERAEAEVRQLREAVMEAATELGLAHEPEWASPAAKEKGLNPVWCAICGSADGSWPCTSRMVLDDLLSAVAEGAEDRGQTDG